MKKVLSIVTGLAISASAFSINIIPGWQLVGTEHDINISTFNNPNIISVWTYDKINKKWKAYFPNKNIDLNNYNIESLDKINAKEGFWINSVANLTLNTNNTGNKDKNISLSRAVGNYPLDTNITLNINNKSCNVDFGDGNNINLQTCKGTIEHTYKYPGVYTITVKQNDEKISSTPVIVNTNDKWVAYVTSLDNYHSDIYDNNDVIKDGEAYIPPKLINIDYYWTCFKYINSEANFSKIKGDNFSLEVRAKDSKKDGGISAYDTTIKVYTDKDKSIGVKMMGDDWGVPWIHMWAGDNNKDNLKELVVDFSDYRIIKFVVKDHKFKVYADDKLLYTLPFSSELGNIVGFLVEFKGSGKLDYLKLFDSKEKLVYSEDFNMTY